MSKQLIVMKEEGQEKVSHMMFIFGWRGFFGLIIKINLMSIFVSWIFFWPYQSFFFMQLTPLGLIHSFLYFPSNLIVLTYTLYCLLCVCSKWCSRFPSRRKTWIKVLFLNLRAVNENACSFVLIQTKQVLNFLFLSPHYIYHVWRR